MEGFKFEEEDFRACCGSTQFAKEMAKASPFSSLEEAVTAARDVWFNKVDVTGWLQAFSAHPQIGSSPPSSAHPTSAQCAGVTEVCNKKYGYCTGLSRSPGR